MDSNRIIEIINDVERNFNVSEIKYKSIKVWPILRLLIGQVLFSNITRNREYENITFSDYIYSALFSFKHRCIYIIKAVKNIGKYTIKNCGDILLISRSSDRTEYINQKYFNRITDSIFYYLKEKFQVGIIDYTNLGNIKEPPFFQSTNVDILLQNALNEIIVIRECANIKRLFSKKDKVLKDITDHLENTYKVYYNWEINLYEMVHVLLAYRKVFLKILRKSKPKCVINVCFYDLVSMATVLACNELKIKSFEIQHGQQGDYHIMYSNWINYPPQGYELIPEIISVWGEKSFLRLHSSFGQSSRHKIIIGGNLWISLWKSGYLLAEENRFSDISIFNNDSKKILFSLQPLTNPIPDYMIDIIRQTQKKIKWYIRLHPRMKERRDEIFQFLLKSGCLNIEIDKSSDLPLYLIFKYIDLHITLWSSIAYEALSFGIHSIIAHKNGYVQMSKYCDDNVFYYSENKNDIINAIVNGRNFSNEANKYIISEPSIFIELINNELVNTR